MMKKISRSVRNELRKMKTMGDDAWTLEFYSLTDSLDDYTAYWITDDQFIIFQKNEHIGTVYYVMGCCFKL